MRTFNLFISHSWSYDDQYNRLIHRLSQRPYFKFRNYSVPRHDPIHNAADDRALRAAIRKQMAPCSVVLILAGVYATYSKWINDEIEIAGSFAQRKPIVAVIPLGAKRASRPAQDAADRIVRWRTESIVQAIREVAP